MAEPTPRPWVRDTGSPTISHGILIDGPRPNKDAIVEVHCDPEDNLSREEAEANADLILRAVNSHGVLMDVLDWAENCLGENRKHGPVFQPSYKYAPDLKAVCEEARAELAKAGENA